MNEKYTEFDRCLATPEMVPLIGRLGKILGSKGLMPSVKHGTVIKDVGQQVKDEFGRVEFREKQLEVSGPIAKMQFSEQDIRRNIDHIVSEILQTAGNAGRNIFLRKIALTSTHGPAFFISDIEKRSSSSLRPVKINI